MSSALLVEEKRGAAVASTGDISKVQHVQDDLQHAHRDLCAAGCAKRDPGLVAIKHDGRAKGCEPALARRDRSSPALDADQTPPCSHYT